MAFIGTVFLYPHSQAPEGFVPCDGREFDKSSNQMLLSSIGDSFGGNGVTTFALPKLDNKFGLRHLICIDGLFSMGIKYTVDFDDDNYIGTVVTFEETDIPQGWALCDGSKHSADENPELATVLGTYNEKAGHYFNYPNSGNERYIICVAKKPQPEYYEEE